MSLAASETAAVYVSPLFWCLLAAVLAIEALVPVDPTQSLVSRGFVVDAVYFGLNMALRAVALSACVALLKTLYDRYLGVITLEAIAAWPAPARLAPAVLAIDFLEWFHHRVRHRVPLFWRFHAVHHSWQQPSTGITDRRVPHDRRPSSGSVRTLLAQLRYAGAASRATVARPARGAGQAQRAGNGRRARAWSAATTSRQSSSTSTCAVRAPSGRSKRTRPPSS